MSSGSCRRKTNGQVVKPMSRKLKTALGLFLVVCIPCVSAQQIVAQGQWKTVDYEVSGEWQIVLQNAQYYVRLDDEFETKNGPDLHIVLSKQRLDRITNENAITQALIVGALQSKDDALFFKRMKGAQTLPLPSGIDLSSYRTILIHCVKHAHLWAGAPL